MPSSLEACATITSTTSRSSCRVKPIWDRRLSTSQFSTLTLPLYMLERYEQELATRAEVLWRNLHRAHSSIGARRAANLHAELMRAFREDLDAAVTYLSPRFEKD